MITGKISRLAHDLYHVPLLWREDPVFEDGVDPPCSAHIKGRLMSHDLAALMRGGRRAGVPGGVAAEATYFNRGELGLDETTGDLDGTVEAGAVD